MLRFIPHPGQCIIKLMCISLMLMVHEGLGRLNENVSVLTWILKKIIKKIAQNVDTEPLRFFIMEICIFNGSIAMHQISNCVVDDHPSVH